MPGRFAVGDDVQTPHGKGVVREVRNNGRLLVRIQQRALVVPESVVTPTKAPRRAAPEPTDKATIGSPAPAPREIDLHGLRVEEALERIDAALDAALLAGDAEVRFIHGRSGGRLRGALHARLGVIPTVCSFRLDPGNPGVTVVAL